MATEGSEFANILGLNPDVYSPGLLDKFQIPWRRSQNGLIEITEHLPQELLDALTEHAIASMKLRGTSTREPALFVDLEDQYFIGPTDEKGGGPYASFCILDPVITVECHDGKLHIAARFNIETTILHYSVHPSNGHELFFHDICLQYLRDSAKESLIVTPQSDPSAAFTVTRTSNVSTSGQAGVTFSGTPSANVSLGLSRSTGLTVEYTVGSWSVSAHHVVHRNTIGERAIRSKGNMESIESDKPPKKFGANDRLPRLLLKHARYQWFWAGSQEETGRLTPDLKHTVKRHVMIKRIIPVEHFPFNCAEEKEMEEAQGKPTPVPRAMRFNKGKANDKQNEGVRMPGKAEITKNADGSSQQISSASVGKDRAILASREHLLRALEHSFQFQFSVKIRVKRRHGRLHRLLLLSNNDVKGAFLKPWFEREFHLQPDSKWIMDFLEEGNRGVRNKEKVKSKADAIGDEGDKGECFSERKEVDQGMREKDNISPEETETGRETEGFIIPLRETADVAAMLEDIKEQNDGKWDKLQGKRLVDILGRESFWTLEDLRSNRRETEELERLTAMELQRLLQMHKRELQRDTAFDLLQSSSVSRRIVSDYHRDM